MAVLYRYAPQRNTPASPRDGCHSGYHVDGEKKTWVSALLQRFHLSGVVFTTLWLWYVQPRTCHFPRLLCSIRPFTTISARGRCSPHSVLAMASKFIGFGCFICAAQRAVFSSNPRHRWQLGVSVDWFLRRLPFRQGHLLACFSCLTIRVVTVRVSNRGEHCTVFYCVLRTRLPSFSEVALPVPYRRNSESANSYTLPPLQSVTRLVVCRTSCCVTVTPCPAG